MKIQSTARMAFISALLTLTLALPALAQGDSVLAQVADGTGADGTQFITKFRITNLGPDPSTEINKLTLLFFHRDGTAWNLTTNLGAGSSFPLDLGSYQTISIDTTGTTPSLTTGYAVVQNRGGISGTGDVQSSSYYAEDYQVAITAFYEIRKGGAVIDTISVPVSQPTLSFVLPVEIDGASNLLTGFAIVNLSNQSNTLSMALFQSTTPTSGEAPAGPSTTITLSPKEQRASFLYPDIFPGISNFKGTLVAKPDYPVAILALLQTPVPNGVQYATMVPAYIDALRHNTYMYLHLGYSLDADRFISDYFWDQDQIQDQNLFEEDLVLPWDLLFEKQTDTTRRLLPYSGAQFAVIGPKVYSDFDYLTVDDLRGLTYSSNPIDMSDGSANLVTDPGGVGNFAFAIKTGLGNYAKVRIADVITRGVDIDLALEVYLYK